MRLYVSRSCYSDISANLLVCDWMTYVALMHFHIHSLDSPSHIEIINIGAAANDEYVSGTGFQSTGPFCIILDQNEPDFAHAQLIPLFSKTVTSGWPPTMRHNRLSAPSNTYSRTPTVSSITRDAIRLPLIVPKAACNLVPRALWNISQTHKQWRIQERLMRYTINLQHHAWSTLAIPSFIPRRTLIAGMRPSNEEEWFVKTGFDDRTKHVAVEIDSAPDAVVAE